MKKIVLLLVSLILLGGCQKEEIEIKKENPSKGAKLELSFEGHNASLFYSNLALVYADHTEKYTTGNANHIKYSFAKSPIPGNQTITFSSQAFSGQGQAVNYGSYTLKVIFNGEVLIEKTFYNDSQASVTVNLPFI